MRVRTKISDLRKQLAESIKLRNNLHDANLVLGSKIEQLDRREQSYKALERQYEAAKISLENIDRIIHKFPPQMRCNSVNMLRGEEIPSHVQLAHILGFIHAQEHRAHEDRVTVSTIKIPGHFVGLDQES